MTTPTDPAEYGRPPGGDQQPFAPPVEASYGGAGDFGGYGVAPYKGQQLGLPQTGINSLASQWMRLAARIVDWLILVVPMLTVYLAMVPADERTLRGFGDFDADNVEASLITLSILAAYEVVFLAWRGATPGKMMCGLRVARIADGQKPTVGEAAIRWAVPSVPDFFPPLGIFSLVDVLWCLWDGNRQCLHDKVVRTVVVTSKEL